MSAKDQRRIQGPVGSLPYYIYQPSHTKNFFENDERKDGRSALDVRPIFMSVGVISQAKGSSFIEFGNTKIVCGVYGPKEVQRGTDFKLTGQVLCEVSFAPFAFSSRKLPQPDRQRKEISRQMKEALEAVIIVEKYPKSQIDIYITIIEEGGSLLSGCLTAAGLALCHASIDVYDLLVGATVLWHENSIYVDPTYHEENCVEEIQRKQGSEGEAKLTIGMMPTFAGGQSVFMIHEGALAEDSLCDGINIATDTCNKIYTLARQTLLNYAENIQKKINET